MDREGPEVLHRTAGGHLFRSRQPDRVGVDRLATEGREEEVPLQGIQRPPRPTEKAADNVRDRRVEPQVRTRETTLWGTGLLRNQGV